MIKPPRNNLAGPASRRALGFTLVELLVVMAIIVIMAGLGLAAFRGGASGDAAKGAAGVASSVFDTARNTAIMRQTPTRVIVDTAWSSSRPDLATHYLRRLTVAYLKLSTDTTAVLTSSGSVDQTNASNWVQADTWTLLPGNIYFDPNYSALDDWNAQGTMSITFYAQNVPSSGYAYYQFLPNGQAPGPPVAVLVSLGASGAVNTLSKTGIAQFVVSTGNVNPSTGAFTERGQGGPSTSQTAPLTCFGFVLFPMGHISFFENTSDILLPQ